MKLEDLYPVLSFYHLHFIVVSPVPHLWELPRPMGTSVERGTDQGFQVRMDGPQARRNRKRARQKARIVSFDLRTTSMM